MAQQAKNSKISSASEKTTSQEARSDVIRRKDRVVRPQHVFVLAQLSEVSSPTGEKRKLTKALQI